MIRGGLLALSTLDPSRTKQGSSTIGMLFILTLTLIIHQGHKTIPGLGFRPTQVSDLLSDTCTSHLIRDSRYDNCAGTYNVHTLQYTRILISLFIVPFDEIIKENIKGSKYQTISLFLLTHACSR